MIYISGLTTHGLYLGRFHTCQCARIREMAIQMSQNVWDRPEQHQHTAVGQLHHYNIDPDIFLVMK